MLWKSFFRNLCLICVIVLFCSQKVSLAQTSRNSSKFSVKGRVIDRESKKGISFASLIVEETMRGVASDINGNYHFSRMEKGKYLITISCINYASASVFLNLKSDTNITIYLDGQTFKLPEVEVMASYKSKEGATAKIEQAALEYIQPISLSDVFLLLPGNIMKENPMYRFQLNTSRQVGSDQNTSFGMGIISDGIPLTNDAMRTQLYGISGEWNSLSSYFKDPVVSRRNRLNAGVDLRNISTDHIESIEVVRGISSAKDGNLSSGAIHIHSKKGVTPLKIRAKSDPLNKSYYMGKGFKISDKLGAIHLGADVLSSTPDVREKLDRFTRLSAQANYTNKIDLLDRPFDFSTKLNLTSSVNNTKSDELIEQNKESYNSSYFESRLSFKGRWQLNHNWIDYAEVLSSLSMTNNLIERNKLIMSTQGPASMPLAISEGEHEGIFLPVKYYSDYKIDNKPVYFFLQTNFSSPFTLGAFVKNNLQYGLEFKSNKNFGRGSVVNPTRPPYPGDNTFIRPRPNYDIPALMHIAAYLEDKVKVDFSESARWESSLGLRTTKMLNLDKAYQLSHKILVEPRLQTSFTLENTTSKGMFIANSLRLGYGEENKLPTIDLLYPDKLYRDFVMLNAFYQDPERDYLLVNTYIHNPTNYHLTENKNQKIEAGWDLKINKFECSVSAFMEQFDKGFSYFQQYYNVAFTRYMTLLHPVEGRPRKEDYQPEEYRDFTAFPTACNSKKTIKKGIEYRIKIPTIKAIQTSIEINGSYYNTVYANGIPVMYRPVVKEFGEKYPYVGIYNGDTHFHNSRLNTNFWFNTHIKQFGLIFTNFVQVVWFTKSYKGKEEDVLPSYYMDLDGVIHSVDKEEISSTTSQLRYLRRARSELYYRAELKPVSVFWNIKASKELGKNVKLSFFANNLFDFNPYYKKANNTTRKEWIIPFFGVELMIQI